MIELRYLFEIEIVDEAASRNVHDHVFKEVVNSVEILSAIKYSELAVSTNKGCVLVELNAFKP
ncbi:hypothetical protein D3C80_2144890 [compost metagenome]